MAELGAVVIKVGADITDLKKKLKEAGDATDSGTKLISGRFVAMGAAVAAAAAAAGIALTKMALKEMDLVGSQQELAQSMGATVAGLRSLKMAADGFGIEGVEGSLTRLNQNLGAFEQGTGRARESIERLRLDVQAMGKMDADEKVAYLADQIKASGISAQEAAFHLKRLGFEQAQAAGAFMQGGDAIRDAREDVERFGLAVSELDASKMDAVGDNILSLGDAMHGITTRMTTALTPAFLEVTDAALDTARAFFDAWNETDELTDSTGKATSAESEFADDGRTMVTPFLEALIRLAGFAADALSTMGAVIGAVIKSAMGGVAAINAVLQSANQAASWVDTKLGLASQAEYGKIAANAQAARDSAVKSAQDTRDAWANVYDTAAGAKYRNAAEKAIENMAKGRANRAGMKAPAAAGGSYNPKSADDGGAGKAGGGKSAADKAAEELKRQEEAAQRELESVQRFLATKQELEAADTNKRLEQLSKAREMGLIGEQAYQDAMLGVLKKNSEAVAGFEDDEYKKAQEKLDKKRELELIGDEEFFLKKMELAAAHEETKKEIEDEQYQMALDNLEQQREDGLLSDAEYYARVESEAAAHQERMAIITAEGEAAKAKIKKQAQEAQMTGYGAFMKGMQAMAENGSRAAFNIHKAAALSEAVIDGYAAITAAFRHGTKTGGVKRGILEAAVAAASTASQIAKIRSTSFGGGGGGGAAAGGGGSVSASQDVEAAADAPKQTVTIALQGEVFGAKQVRDLIEKINDATKNGAVLNMV